MIRGSQQRAGGLSRGTGVFSIRSGSQQLAGGISSGTGGLTTSFWVLRSRPGVSASGLGFLAEGLVVSVGLGV